jgi:hypothetical protein
MFVIYKIDYICTRIYLLKTIKFKNIIHKNEE